MQPTYGLADVLERRLAGAAAPRGARGLRRAIFGEGGGQGEAHGAAVEGGVVRPQPAEHLADFGVFQEGLLDRGVVDRAADHTGPLLGLLGARDVGEDALGLAHQLDCIVEATLGARVRIAVGVECLDDEGRLAPARHDLERLPEGTLQLVVGDVPEDHLLALVHVGDDPSLVSRPGLEGHSKGGMDAGAGVRVYATPRRCSRGAH
mmetsp:Transcript_58114/g.184890  ORF Transcript_58114/g.184890 Transcript_58114/m.184890 type:complete len:206 (-) Transcript_58114:73-690(-)